MPGGRHKLDYDVQANAGQVVRFYILLYPMDHDPEAAPTETLKRRSIAPAILPDWRSRPCPVSSTSTTTTSSSSSRVPSAISEC